MSASEISLAVLRDLIADPDALDLLAVAFDLRAATRATAGASNERLTTATAAAIAGLHVRTIRRALDAGTLRGEKRAGRWQIEPADLDVWLARGAPTAAERSMTNGRTRGARPGLTGADAIARAGCGNSR